MANIKRTSPRPRKHRRIPSPATQNVLGNMGLAARTYRILTDEERQEWREYAATLTAVDPKTGLLRPRQGDKVFVGLTCRFLHVNTPAPPCPRTPPPYLFAGDPLHVTAQATADGVLFTATGPTSPHVRVELLLQRLPSPARSPQPGRYRTQAFVSFGPGSEVAAVPVPGGWYIPAYRFINADTGQDTPIFVLPKVTVGEGAGNSLPGFVSGILAP